MTRTTSPAGRAAITQREGCILRAYRDSVGVLTIGVGHTGRMSPPVVCVGDVITAKQADAYLASDLAPVEAAIARVVTVPTTQNQHDAMASLAFNIGVNGFAGSTVVHKLNAGDVAGAAEAFLMWEHPPELASRRKTERAQFLTPDATPAISVDADKPVLAGIERAVNAAAAPPFAIPAGYVPPAPYHKLLPAPAGPGFWAWVRARFTGKAA